METVLKIFGIACGLAVVSYAIYLTVAGYNDKEDNCDS